MPTTRTSWVGCWRPWSPGTREAPETRMAERLPSFTRRYLVAIALTGVCLGGPNGAMAQQPPTDTTRAVLEPILVRAPASPIAIGVPRPVAVLEGEDLRGGRAAVFLEEAVQGLPGVQIQNRYNFAVGERLVVRGFGGRAQFGLRGVRVLVDGVPATLADGQTTLDHLDVATLGRVEAQRGPAASLYGNAAGGVLHFQTRQPADAALRPEAFTVFGADGLRQIRGTVEGQVDDVGYLLSAARTDYDGFRRDPLADDGSTYGAAQRTSANATLHVPGASGRLTAVANVLDLAAENPGSLSAALLEEDGRQAFRNNVRQQTRKDVRQGQVGVSWDGAVADNRVELGTYGLMREVENPIPSDVIVLDRTAFGGRALVERSMRAAGRGFSLGGGVEFDSQRDDRRNYANNQGERGELGLDQFETVRGLGAFSHVRIEVSGSADVSAGLRYDHFRFGAEDRFVGDDPDDSGERSMDALSPSLGLTVRPAAAVELFGSISTSFETPSTTELANRPGGAGGFNPDLEPQRGTTLEAGLRTELGRVGVEATAHRTDLRDELIPFEVEGVPGRTFFRNAGSSRHQGFEIALAARLPAGLGGRLSYSYLDARFEDYAVGDNVFDGNRIPGMAPHHLDGLLRWAPGPWFTEARGVYRGAVPVNDAATEEASPHFLLDLRLGSTGFSAAGLELAPSVGVNNVLDREHVAAVTVNAFGGRFYEPGPGRSIFLTIRAAPTSR
jgi:iron complex outermembrane recepter protein